MVYPESTSGQRSVQNAPTFAVRTARQRKWLCNKNKAVEPGEHRIGPRSDLVSDVFLREWSPPGNRYIYSITDARIQQTVGQLGINAEMST